MHTSSFPSLFFFFFFNDTATTEIYTLSLHDALPICLHFGIQLRQALYPLVAPLARPRRRHRHACGLPRSHGALERALVAARGWRTRRDLLGSGVRRVLRAAGRGLRPGRAAPDARAAAG